MTTTTSAQGRDTFDLYHTNMFEVGAGLVKPYVGNGARPTAVSVHVRAASPESRRNRDIYARVGVPEFWRYSEAAGLKAFTLVDGTYEAIEISRVIPRLPIAEIATRITDDTESWEALRAWRNWLQATRPV